MSAYGISLTFFFHKKYLSFIVISVQVLHIKEERLDLTADEVKAKYSSGNSLVELIRATMMDSVYGLRLMYELNVIPLALQITNIAGQILVTQNNNLITYVQ